MTLFPELTELMSLFRFFPRRQLSQHFITDEKVLEKMVSLAGLSEKEVVLEVGVGTGFLSTEILAHCKKLIGFEFDETLQKVLIERFEKELSKKKLELFNEDFFSFAGKLEFDKVIAFPPFHKTQNLMFKLFEFDFSKAVLLLPSDTVEKLSALPGFKDYNSLSVLTQYLFEIERKGVVKPKSFYPKPEILFELMVLNKKTIKQPVSDLKLFSFFVLELFRFKNKNYAKALTHAKPFLEKRLQKNIKLTEQEFSNLKVCQLEVNELVKSFNELV
ncbi:MAG: rRNA adenine dimethyltransferase family protein [archaeon]